MRGQRTSIAGKRVDVVVVAARYSSHDHRLQWVQAYERRGKVWGDKVLIDRADLLERLAGKRRVSTGHLKELAGDFELGRARTRGVMISACHSSEFHTSIEGLHLPARAASGDLQPQLA
jgi:hypothetical protein